MALNGIDISSYQTGIDLWKVPADFVIVKATQGTTYLNPDFERAAQSTLAAGKLLGIYHYAAGGDPSEEAEWFISKFCKYVGDAIPVLDWEEIQNSRVNEHWSWCKVFVEKVEASCGVKPVIYVQKSFSTKFKNSGCDLWIAQYASNDDVVGYQDKPWNEGRYDCLIRQYTSCGVLDGWDGKLDLNKFYGAAEDWKALCKSSTAATATVTVAPASTDEALEVDGYWGTKTTLRLQQVLGTPQDGIVSHQWTYSERSGQHTTGWEYDTTKTGSTVIRALQKKVGTSADGLWGAGSRLALIKYYGVAYYKDAVKALQTHLNAGEV